MLLLYPKFWENFAFSRYPWVFYAFLL